MRSLRIILSSAFVFATTLPVHAKTVVNDVTGLNPIEVSRVLEPRSVDEIKNAVKSHPGPISIGGGRYSMGGQTATENALQIDMRALKKIIKLDVAGQKVTVQAGARWRDIQEVIDKHGLAIRIMQTYSNFTVGGSLSVNAHGRDIGEGPLVRSVESIKVVLGDGREVRASRSENKNIFFAAIGGYGGIGVITEATLSLVPNHKIRRELKELPVEKYKEHFFKEIRGNKDAVFHNGDLFPPDYKHVKLETWYRTDQPLTLDERLIPEGRKYWLDPTVISSISLLPFGKELREKLLEPALRKQEMVAWRNREASYDLARLEPTTPRLLYTYVLQEYFVPVDRFDEFVPKMRAVFQKYDVNVLNVSIRHAMPDPGTFLAWAPEEVFSFVVYYKQATTEAAKKKVATWTREMIEQVLSVNGRYYLPYQIHATPEQFKKAYPGFQKFFDVKKSVDPTNKFRNKLWDAYYLSAMAPALTPATQKK
jgi:FAD/FMN-containing dehydrogenase